jgi:molecular chaperone GrpE
MADVPLDPTLEDDLGAEYDLTVGERAAFEGLRLELEEARAQVTANLDLAQRKQADFENFRKRMRVEQADAAMRAGRRIIEEILPVLDNLERAIEHTTAGGDLAELLKGVEMVHGQVLDVLCKEGVEIQDPFGSLFDPEFHQAVGQLEDDTAAEGTVAEVYQKGYVMHGRVIRPAQVVVSTGGPAPQKE